MIRNVIKSLGPSDTYRSFNVIVLQRHAATAQQAKNTAPKRSGVEEVKYNEKAMRPRESHEGFQIVYRCKPVNIVAVFSRLKIYQTALFVCGTPFAYAMSFTGHMSLGAANTTAVAGGVATLTLMYFSYVTRRLIGLIWYNEEKELVKVAYLTFWGKRDDVTFPLESMPLLDDPQENYTKPLVKLQLMNSPQFFFVSLRYGIVWDDKLFVKLFGKLAFDQYKRIRRARGRYSK